MNSFTKQLWQSTRDIYKAIIAHPFNTELAQGTLAIEKFQYYVQQDELYIQAYAHALNILSVKAPASAISNDLLSYANDGILVEKALHDHFFLKFKISPAPEAQPACFSYINFLLATTALQPFEIGVSALLPCFWIYREVGVHISRKASPNNPFQPWIDTYIDDDYSRDVDRMIEITDKTAAAASGEVKLHMQRVFAESVRLEFVFWDAAYRLEKWVL